MFLRAGAVSLVLLLASRLLGLLRESAQAAAFGATPAGDVSVLMVHLPDLLASVVASGALAYVLLPAWATQAPAQVAASQRRVAHWLLGGGLVVTLAWLLAGDALVRWLVPGLPPPQRPGATHALWWSAAAVTPALLAALWATRLQRERDFLGLYGANLVANGVVVAALLLVTQASGDAAGLHWVGTGLLAAGALRLAWLRWRLQPWHRHAPDGAPPPRAPLPVWLWAIVAAGLPLALPFAARSLASRGGAGDLASFNYAWKLVELPLQLAIQLVATLALGPIAEALARPDGADAARAILRRAFALAWVLACASLAALLVAAPAVAALLFGWGRMQPEALAQIGRWGQLGAWSLLPQALAAVAVAVLAARGQLRAGALAHAVALALLLLVRPADGGLLMLWLVGLSAGVCLVLLLALGRAVVQWLPWPALAAGLAGVAVAQVAATLLGPLRFGAGLALGCLAGGLPLAAAWWASADFRAALRR